MTRETAESIVLRRGGGCHRTAFEDYAREGEEFDGAAFWSEFASLEEFWDDFERYLFFEGRPLAAYGL